MRRARTRACGAQRSARRQRSADAVRVAAVAQRSARRRLTPPSRRSLFRALRARSYPGNAPNLLTSLWPHSTFGESGVFVAGNTLSGSAQLFGFDVVAWVWTPFANTLANFQAADLFSFGGFALAAGGATDDMSQQLAFIQTNAGPNAAWQQATMSGVPTGHDGHRLVPFGGLLFMIGGFTPAGFSNEMWAADIAGFFGSATNGPGDPNANVPWVLVQPINSAGVFTPRGAFSVSVYSATIILFGGLTRSLPGPNGPDPVCALPGSNCVVYNDIWFYQPGLMSKPVDTTMCGGGNCGWYSPSINGAKIPAGRYGHAAGVLADNLYVFGGVDASGNFFSDLWVFNIEDRVWVQATSKSPAAPTRIRVARARRRNRPAPPRGRP